MIIKKHKNVHLKNINFMMFYVCSNDSFYDLLTHFKS